MTPDQVLAKYDAQIKALVANPETVQENTWRGLLASFAFELAAVQAADTAAWAESPVTKIV